MSEKVELKEYDLTAEVYREYTYGGATHRINNPQKLWFAKGGTSHRVQDADGKVWCAPVPGLFGCILSWLPRDKDKPVQF